MTPVCPEDEWAQRLALHLMRLGTRTDPDVLYAMGVELYATRGHLLPEDVARDECIAAPPPDD